MILGVDAFLQRMQVVSGLPCIVGGYLCGRKRIFQEPRVAIAAKEDPLVATNLSRRLAIRLAVFEKLRADLDGADLAESEDYPIWLQEGDMLIGIGQPTMQRYPVIACCPGPDAGHRTTLIELLRFGLIYLAQTTQLADEKPQVRAEDAAYAMMKVLSVGCFVLDSQCRILHDGRGPKPESQGPWIIINGRLSLSSEAEREALRKAVLEAISDRQRCSLVPVTSPAGLASMAAVTSLVQPGNGRFALVLFDTRKTDHSALRTHFFKAHALTRSESLIAREVLDGRTLNEMAEATGLSVATVRSYLKQVMAKTGTHRQSELVALYYSSIIPVGYGNSEGGVMPF